jgi:choline dehydrogenase-like flavoprotein
VRFVSRSGGASLHRNRESVDVCVIGSGAGGSIIAFEAAKRGLSTLLVERGPYVRARDMTHSELDMFALLYKDGALQLNTSLDMFIVQGSCVGGSTVLANMVMLRPDAPVLEGWKNLGAVFDDAELARSYDKVEEAIGAAPVKPGNINASTKRFVEGAQALGLRPKVMKKALGDCVGCGYCNIGCVFNTKRSALATYVPWAERHGARVLAETAVERLVHDRGRVRFAEAVRGPDKEPVTIEAKVFVVSAGPIGSSAVLQKSGIKKNVGTRVSFNAGSMAIAEFPENLDAFDGDQITVYLQGDGFLIEPTHYPAMTMAIQAPGFMGDHGRFMKISRTLGCAGALVPTEAAGRVVQSPFFGHEETRYSATPGDLARLKRGLEVICRAFLAAGAKRVSLQTAQKVVAFEHPSEVSRLASSFHTAKEICFGSSHPMGGNPLSDDRALGVVDRSFGVHDFDNLCVVDASIFPSALGVNPLSTIMAFADYAAPRVLARVG